MAEFDAHKRCDQCGDIHDESDDAPNEGEHLAKVAEEAFFDLVRDNIKKKLLAKHAGEIEHATDVALDAMKLLWREDMRGTRDDSAWETLHLRALAIWKKPGSSS